MKTISINLYQFSELSEIAQQKAIEKLSDINVDHEWWDNTYEDAKNIGLKITSFDLERRRHAKGEFILTPIEVAGKILSEHGKDCESYKTAHLFMNDFNELIAQNDSGQKDYDIEELENEFLNDLLEDYSIILQNESEYLQSKEAIIDTIQANEYDFTEDGKLY